MSSSDTGRPASDVVTISNDEFERLCDDLVATVAGTVVEIGAGTGANFGSLPRDIRWIGIEPHRRTRMQLAEAAASAGFDAPLDARAETIPLPDASADVVLSTLVFCSVDDLDRAMAEARRVLRPGGRLVFAEHVVAPPRTFIRGLQRFATPVVARVDRNCHWTRDPLAAADRAGFRPLDVRRYSVRGRLPGAGFPFVLYQGER